MPSVWLAKRFILLIQCEFIYILQNIPHILADSCSSSILLICRTVFPELFPISVWSSSVDPKSTNTVLENANNERSMMRLLIMCAVNLKSYTNKNYFRLNRELFLISEHVCKDFIVYFLGELSKTNKFTNGHNLRLM